MRPLRNVPRSLSRSWGRARFRGCRTAETSRLIKLRRAQSCVTLVRISRRRCAFQRRRGRPHRADRLGWTAGSDGSGASTETLQSWRQFSAAWLRAVAAAARAEAWKARYPSDAVARTPPSVRLRTQPLCDQPRRAEAATGRNPAAARPVLPFGLPAPALVRGFPWR
jgi:hypothetical protein